MFAFVREIIRETKVTPQVLRTFGLLFGVILVAVSIWRDLVPLAVAGGIIACAALAWPRGLGPLYYFLLVISAILGFIVSHVAIAILYFLAFTLTKIVLVIVRKDIIGLRREPGRQSFWQPTEAASDMEKQY